MKRVYARQIKHKNMINNLHNINYDTAEYVYPHCSDKVDNNNISISMNYYLSKLNYHIYRDFGSEILRHLINIEITY